MTQQIFLVGRYRITADVTVKNTPPNPANVGSVDYAIAKFEEGSGPATRGFSELTWPERHDFYNQITTFATTLEHGFASLLFPTDPVLEPTKFN